MTVLYGVMEDEPGRLGGALRPPIALTVKALLCSAFCDAGGGTRTPDTRIMIGPSGALKLLTASHCGPF
jgi:hypothetical protein